MSPRNLKFGFQAFAAGAAMFLLGTVAFLPQAAARDLTSDPNLAQRVQEFNYKPTPSELILKPKSTSGKHVKKPAKDAKN
jgi:hypothetical protein